MWNTMTCFGICIVLWDAQQTCTTRPPWFYTMGVFKAELYVTDPWGKTVRLPERSEVKVSHRPSPLRPTVIQEPLPFCFPIYFMLGIFCEWSSQRTRFLCISGSEELCISITEAAGSWLWWLQANQGAGWRMAIVHVKYHLPRVIRVY